MEMPTIPEAAALHGEIAELKSVIQLARERNNELLEQRRKLAQVADQLAYSVSEMRANEYHAGRIKRACDALSAYDKVRGQ